MNYFKLSPFSSSPLFVSFQKIENKERIKRRVRIMRRGEVEGVVILWLFYGSGEGIGSCSGSGEGRVNKI